MAPIDGHWTAERRQMPSEYTISIDGKDLTCFLVKKKEAEIMATYAWIKQETGKDVYAVGVAAEHGEAKYPVD